MHIGLPSIGLNMQLQSGITTALQSALALSDVFIDPTISSTITGSPVAIIASPRSSGFTTAPNFQRSTLGSPGDRPAISGSRLVFDGTNDVLDYSAGYSFVSATTPADPFYSQAGKGPTVVGIDRASDGTWWVGHYGKLNESTAAGETFDGSLIHYSANFDTILQEVRFQTLGLSGVGIQGVVIDPQDGMIWCADPANTRIYKIDTVGISVNKNFNVGAACNGIAYDSINNQVLYSVANSTTVTRINKTTGASISTFTLRDITNNSNDMLYFDGSFGAAGALYQTVRDNGTNGRVIKYDLNNGATPIKSWSIQEVKAVEGLVVYNGAFYICDDEYYHNQAAGVNRIVQVSADASSADYGTKLVMAGVAKVAATPASTVALLTGGDFASSGAQQRCGVGLFYTTTVNQFRFIARFNALQATCDYAIASTTTEYIYYLVMDTIAHTATLFINGEVAGTTVTDNTNLVGSMPRLVWTLGASYESTGNPVRFSNTTHGGFIVTTDTTHRAEIEGYLAWQTGNQGLLPVGHTYKSAAPT